MASRTLPGLGLKGDWALGEDNWKDEMDDNLVLVSSLLHAAAIDVVADVPASPSEGDIYILNDTHPTNADNIAIFDEGAWVYVLPREGMIVFDRSQDAFLFYALPAGWTVLSSGGGPTTAVYRIGFFFTTAPTAGEILMMHTFTDACTFADDFAGSAGDVGTNPAASFTMDVQLNGASVGSITISDAGAITFATTGGTVGAVAGDQLRVIGPATAGTAANVSITLRGEG